MTKTLGLGPTICKQGSNQAIRFLVYNDLSKILKEYIPYTPAIMVAGGVAGAVSVFGNTYISNTISQHPS